MIFKSQKCEDVETQEGVSASNSGLNQTNSTMTEGQYIWIRLQKQFEFDTNCSICKESIKLIEKLDSWEDFQKWGICINPDYNAGGVVTHYHLDIVNREQGFK